VRAIEGKSTVSGGIPQHWTRGFAVLAAFLTLALSAPSRAADVTPADLQAAMRSLGFLTSLQNRPSVTIGVIYHAGEADSKMQAARVAASLARLSGPGSATVSATLLSVQDLPQSTLHLDALYLLSLPAENGRTVSDFVKRQNVVSISADPACLDMGSCVLMVQARSSMTIVLDTALAQAAGAKFSTVFTMLVKRR